MIPSDPGGKRGNYYQILDDNPPTKKKYNINNTYDFPTNFQTKTKINKSKYQPKFITIKSTDPEKTINSFNVFLVHKALESITIEKPEKIAFTRDGGLLILSKNENQTKKFLNATNLSNLCKIKTELHPTLNISKGVIYCPSLTNLSEKEIVEGLSSQNVTECRKITKFNNGSIINTPLHIISFNLFEIPNEIDIAWEKIKVNPYIPAPMQCKNCFKIGHTKKHCQSDSKCFVCSASEHSDSCEIVKCINCNEKHRSNNKKCPVYIKRQQIIKHKTLFKCTYREAVTAVNQTGNVVAPSPIDSLEESKTLKLKIQNRKEQLKTIEIAQTHNQNTQNTQDSSQNSPTSLITPSSSTPNSSLSYPSSSEKINTLSSSDSLSNNKFSESQNSLPIYTEKIKKLTNKQRSKLILNNNENNSIQHLDNSSTSNHMEF